MLKAEVVFDGALVKCNGFVILCDGGIQWVYKDMVKQDSFWNLEQAIAFCMEHQA